MDKTNINVLVQSIERSLYLICKKLFHLNKRNSYEFGPNLISLNVYP